LAILYGNGKGFEKKFFKIKFGLKLKRFLTVLLSSKNLIKTGSELKVQISMVQKYRVDYISHHMEQFTIRLALNSTILFFIRATLMSGIVLKNIFFSLA
jgi:hypothetical protein